MNAADLLERRAGRLRAYHGALPEELQFWMAEFPAGARRCALALEQLVACRRLGNVVPVPSAPTQVLGVYRFQGRFLPVFSLAALLGLSGWRRDPSVLVLVDMKGGELAAFDCEEVPKMRAVPQAWMEAAGAPGAEALKTLVFPGEPALTLIDPARLFRQGEALHAK